MFLLLPLLHTIKRRYSMQNYPSVEEALNVNAIISFNHINIKNFII